MKAFVTVVIETKGTQSCLVSFCCIKRDNLGVQCGPNELSLLFSYTERQARPKMIFCVSFS